MEYIALAVAVLGLLLLFSAGKRLGRRRFGSATGRGLFAFVLLGAGALLGLIGADLHTYARLTAEQNLAQVHIVGSGPQQFNAEVTLSDGRKNSFALRGDQWQIDARILKWDGPAVLVGADTLYRLDRISGRYASVADETSRQRTAHDLAGENRIDLWQAAQDFPLPWVDAEYGSAAYVPAIDDGRFEVSLGSNGLIIRTADEATAQAMREAW